MEKKLEFGLVCRDDKSVRQFAERERRVKMNLN